MQRIQRAGETGRLTGLDFECNDQNKFFRGMCFYPRYKSNFTRKIFNPL
jgi:hypothetical protein